MFELFAAFAEMPWVILVPAAAFALLAVKIRDRALWFASGLWALYAAYEGAVSARLLCSGDCAIRADLLLIAPLLLLASLWVLGRVALTALRRN